MRRRTFLHTLGAAAAWPLAAHAEPAAKLPTIGLLLVQAPGSKEFARELPRALQKLGYVEGRDIRFEVRSDEGRQDLLPALAQELVRLNVDVIVTWFTPAAHAARAATRDIPIVIGSGAAIETGLVDSLSRPGGNITGMTTMGPELDGKMVELVRELLPSAKQVAAMANMSDPFSRPFIKEIELAGEATHTAIDTIKIRGRDELDAGFAALQRDRSDAVIVQPSLGLDRPAALALQHRIPAVEHFREFAEAGGLMSYSTLQSYLYRRVAALVGKILKGAKPADLPVEQANRFELVLNLKTAKTLGLTIPPAFLQRADDVIE